jgi:glycosyltransferase involved in cell wall biosynthesis
MPSRTYNILAAGKPILALTEKDSELARVVEEDNIGWIAPPDEPETLLKIIEKIYNERTEISEMNSRARRSALEKYGLETALDKYRQAIN